MNETSIALIIPYFGKWPEWINLYFYSCEQNNEINWYFFTDCEVPKNISPNLHFNQISFKDYCKYVSKILEIDFNPISPYKLCDLKPFYGHIHKDILVDFDFWGFGDVDVVWGDLKSFYTNKLLSKLNLFSSHADRVSGHLTIIRNNNQFTETCFQIKNWKIKLESQTSFALDEHDFSWLIYPPSKYITKFYGKIIRKLFNWRDAWVIYYNLMPLINFLLGIRYNKLYFKEQHTTPILGNDGRSFEHDSEEWIYKNGKIINSKNRKEYIYLHFMIYKKNSFRDDYFWKGDYYQIPENFDYSEGVKINKKGIFPL